MWVNHVENHALIHVMEIITIVANLSKDSFIFYKTQQQTKNKDVFIKGSFGVNRIINLIVCEQSKK